MFLMTEVVRPYRGVSADERRAARRAQLLEAGLEVVGREGLAAATVNAVCAEAGLTKRYFYESFTDRDTLLEELLEGLHTGLLERVRTALDASGATGPRARVRLTVDLLVHAMDDRRMARLYAEAAGHPGLQARRREAYDVYADLVTREVLGLEDPTPAARVAALVFVTGTTEAVVGWLEGRIDLTREALVDTLADLAVAVPLA